MGRANDGRVDAMRRLLPLCRLVGFSALLWSGCETLDPKSQPAPIGIGPMAHLTQREPCRYTGTIHSYRRARLEIMRMKHTITLEEWKCMARELAGLDKRFTRACLTEEPTYAEFHESLQRGYEVCVGTDRTEIVEEALGY